jgi:hypothetical protein
MCDQPEQSYFTGLLDYLVYEAELANCSEVRTYILEEFTKLLFIEVVLHLILELSYRRICQN